MGKENRDFAFIETIKAVDGKLFHMKYHQQRFDQTLRAFNTHTAISLSEFLDPPSRGIIRCRVHYDQSGILDVSYHSYTPRTFKMLQAVVDNRIEYRYKGADRTRLNALFDLRGEADDIVIIKNGLITDTSIANIALYDGQQWVTPASPLLYGTTRQRLLNTGMIVEKEIMLKDLENYSKVAIMNAMLGFTRVDNGIIT